MTEVAVRKYRWGSAVWHETDENGRPACRMGDQDIDYRTFDEDELPDGAQKCSYCDETMPHRGGSNGDTLAARLEDPDVTSAEDLDFESVFGDSDEVSAR